MIRNFAAVCLWVAFLAGSSNFAAAQGSENSISGRVLDAGGMPIAGASVGLVHGQRMPHHPVITNASGHFEIPIHSAFSASTKNLNLSVTAAHYQATFVKLDTQHDWTAIDIRLLPLLSRQENVVVTADINIFDVMSPDPAEKVFVKQDLLDANPGRPGAPVSVPGYPIETASSGIKAPQYFAPGVSGDHGEPIAQYIAVGTALIPNNLSANAHGNGYSDPNIFIPAILESVQVDGGAFNVRQGNHSVNLAATYGLRSHLDQFLTVTGDYRDIDLVAGFSPTERSFVAIEASYGNGFLKRLEHRQQYKFNGQRIFKLGNHDLTLFGIGYYGFSYLPGLTPIFSPGESGANDPDIGDTIDPRQKDQTHVALAVLNDTWRLTSSQQLQLSSYFRTYNLALISDFGQGLIRQSEFRTVTGATSNYVNRFNDAFNFFGGLEFNREAPRRDNLDHYGYYTPGDPTYGPFSKVSSNNVTISSVTPYAAGSGELGPYIRYYAGWRRDQINIQNQDILDTSNSFERWVGVNSPKATISFVPKQSWFLPLISGSFGQAFYTEDPRIGTGSIEGSPVATAHAYQLVISKTLLKTDMKVTLGHVASSQQLAKIDADSGLQEDQGPGLLKFFTAAVRRNFSEGSVLVTFSKADAREVLTGYPIAEAPRTIFDILGNIQKLPFHLQARGEIEFVGRKPLGTGCYPDPNAQCVGTSVREFRAAAVRPFMHGRMNIGINMLIAGGYTGQTVETLYPSEVQQVVGVRIPSYASLNFTYKFGHSIF